MIATHLPLTGWLLKKSMKSSSRAKIKQRKRYKKKNWRRRYHRNWEHNNRISFFYFILELFHVVVFFSVAWLLMVTTTFSNMGSWTDPIKRSNTSTSHANTKPTILRHVFFCLFFVDKIPWRITFWWYPETDQNVPVDTPLYLSTRNQWWRCGGGGNILRIVSGVAHIFEWWGENLLQK